MTGRKNTWNYFDSFRLKQAYFRVGRISATSSADSALHRPAICSEPVARIFQRPAGPQRIRQSHCTNWAMHLFNSALLG